MDYMPVQQPDDTIVQVNIWNFIRRRLCKILTHEQTLAHVSTYSLVNIYNASHKLVKDAPNHFDWPDFGEFLTDQIYTMALHVYCLLNHFNCRKKS
ncbi:hypothetical protein CROQUDRAFT_667421 [Cronartium quercuum f. sp. fusiforme G11]|uniref:Uncharacterized protein n=1 Tax=Cronartium quercuum f. sp. fusiforme G11 TaxID=708437 RepID=A0A9P6NUV8_9BASI|nr:hypothetical protein CROQUDRAFT_667421 [Cronartium quercuum f. sp. fusiforme G11]